MPQPHPLLVALADRVRGLLPGRRRPAVPAPEPLDEAAFEALHRRVVPAAPEPWEALPWETALAAAVVRGRRERKPLFVWAMDGHPLGGT